MLLSAIVAMAPDGLIGNADGLPWHLPRDLKRFRKLTLGKPILMGRKTHEAIGRVLDKRLNVVLTHGRDYHEDGCHVAHSVAEAIAVAEGTGQEEAMVIGGAAVFRELLPSCDRVYLTIVEGQFQGDVFFPTETLSPSEWETVHEEHWPADAENSHSHTFRILQRRGRSQSETAPRGLLP